jgi:hypothetical protein
MIAGKLMRIIIDSTENSLQIIRIIQWYRLFDSFDYSIILFNSIDKSNNYNNYNIIIL